MTFTLINLFLVLNWKYPFYRQFQSENVKIKIKSINIDKVEGGQAVIEGKDRQDTSF